MKDDYFSFSAMLDNIYAPVIYKHCTIPNYEKWREYDQYYRTII